MTAEIQAAVKERKGSVQVAEEGHRRRRAAADRARQAGQEGAAGAVLDAARPHRRLQQALDTVGVAPRAAATAGAVAVRRCDVPRASWRRGRNRAVRHLARTEDSASGWGRRGDAARLPTAGRGLDARRSRSWSIDPRRIGLKLDGFADGCQAGDRTSVARPTPDPADGAARPRCRAAASSLLGLDAPHRRNGARGVDVGLRADQVVSSRRAARRRADLPQRRRTSWGQAGSPSSTASSAGRTPWTWGASAPGALFRPRASWSTFVLALTCIARRGAGGRANARPTVDVASPARGPGHRVDGGGCSRSAACVGLGLLTCRPGQRRTTSMS